MIVLDGGETSGANRLPFLETGIVDILARVSVILLPYHCPSQGRLQTLLLTLSSSLVFDLCVLQATNGLGVILEHRFYGDSHPYYPK